MIQQAAAGPDDDLGDLLDALPSAVLVTNRALEVCYVNPAWERLYDKARDCVTGRALYELNPLLEQYNGALLKCLRDGETIKAGPYRAQLLNGAKVLSSVTMPWRDKAGEICGLMFLSHELSASEAGAYEIRTDERLRLAAELAGVYIWELDLASGAGWATGAQDTFFEGAVGAKEVGRDLMSSVHPEDRARVAALWEKSVREGRPYRSEYRLNRDDKLVWVSASAAITAGTPKHPTRLLGVMQDITERKQAELAANAGNQAKGEFLATMSHEIRTPLNGILGMAQAMSAAGLPEEQRRRLDIIQESGRALLAILNDVLDLSKIEAGMLELEEVEFDLSELVASACNAFSALAQAKKLRLDVNLRQAEGHYLGDPTRLRQIIYNLVSNALKFTEDGVVSVSADFGDGELRLVVQDTGIGIPELAMPVLFESFQQVDASTTRKHGGTGLGLVICRRLAELCGGAINVTSKVGSGSTFVVTMPMRRVTPELEAVDGQPPRQVELARSLKLLAAEDNAVNQMVLRALLEQAGLQVHIVENGAEAVAAWSREAWDLVLMDIQMPELDGVSATRLIRSEEQKLGRARTPIIALTAKAMPHQVAEHAAAGFDDHVSKPIIVQELFSVIAAVLASSELPQPA